MAVVSARDRYVSSPHARALVPPLPEVALDLLADVLGHHVDPRVLIEYERVRAYLGYVGPRVPVAVPEVEAEPATVASSWAGALVGDFDPLDLGD